MLNEKQCKIDKYSGVRVIQQVHYKFSRGPNQRGGVGESMLKF